MIDVHGKAPLAKRDTKLDWRFNEFAEWELTVKILTQRGVGEYEIHLTPRPSYCDRGDWLIHVEGHNSDLDGADGFPRYFFGSGVECKVQMERWLERRAAYRDALKKDET
jgi:hypothetical protein